jgi:hypothetical protein
MEMDHFLRHSTQPHRTGSQIASRIATWLWPAPAADAGTRQDDAHAGATAQAQDDSGDQAWSMKTMRWVPLVVPLAALFMLLLAVLIGSRLY